MNSTKCKEQLLSLLFPHKCFCCGQVLEGTGYLCGACKQKLPLTNGELCHCGKYARECMCDVGSGYTQAVAPFYYTREIAYGIYRFKYDGRSYYAGFLARYMEEQIRRAYAGIPFDGITYVPMHDKKRRQRGYCQTRLLAKKLADQLHLPLKEGLLYHTGKGTAQTQQPGRAARDKNARISYEAHPADLDGQLLLLVDDVLTTGSTVRRCAGLLRERGAKQVYVVTVATTKEEKN
jgi:ComF family protein